MLTMAYNSQPHRSTGIAPFELVIPRRIPNLSVRNLPPGTSVKHGGLKDGSALSRKREFMAHLRKRIPDVVEALRKTQQRYKRNFDAGVSPRNARLRVGDYVYTTQHTREHKLQSKAVGPFVILDGDDSTYVIDVDGEEVRVNSDHVTPAPRPTDADNTPHPLLDNLDNLQKQPEVEDEYVIDRLVGIREKDGQHQAKVRWFDYDRKDDTWEPLKHLPRNVVIRHLRRIKKVIPGYDWRPKGTRQSPRLRSASPAKDSVMLVTTPDTWRPHILNVHVDVHGQIVACVTWRSDHFEMEEHVPLYYMRRTLLDQIPRNFRFDPTVARLHYMRLDARYGPHTVEWPATAKSKPPKREEAELREDYPVDDHVWCTGNLWLAPSPSAVDNVIGNVIDKHASATIVVPMWENQLWYGRAMSRSYEYEVLPPILNTEHAHQPTWTMVAFRFERTFPGEWRALSTRTERPPPPLQQCHTTARTCANTHSTTQAAS